ncbi:PH domain-containing protein [Catenovulum sp. 2E275]|uniref:PH domain-containing protein n=1 Tax=Catenovulum sp. 2E275 TaxID=2980497 RepID=UPI0021CE6311|nr:PH domain-containing protein [Catenovulum sp. 2E275]MCU4675126.1 PH domain-containing protein [Catenovulum sp. 2E275]
MGLLDGLMGNASQVDSAKVEDELSPILGREEQVTYACKEIRDMYVFTNKRLILIDKQGMTGKKVEYHSIPYKAISHFSLETAGHFDLESELKIWISGSSDAIKRDLKNGETVVGIQQALANYALG